MHEPEELWRDSAWPYVPAKLLPEFPGFDPGRYIRQFNEMPHDPAGNIGLRMMAGLVDDMRYICLADCNVFIITIPLDKLR